MKSVNCPTRNGTHIHLWGSTAGNTLVQKYDRGWEPEVTYTGFTTVIRFPTTPWVPRHFYYATFDRVANSTEFCDPESASVTDPTFWVYSIWNSALSSTATTTTTPFTTVTVTTKLTLTTSLSIIS
ncbi:unnamed protein product [Adineta ricciae]|uniref:Uncharacterized protein n=1 Tax=Adineta ricciae TaxID=249248 RepID=A0A814D1P4_ADIRI|nr:unnamed protein product [Adineta ricciae]CAF0947263.1 unnamed protein product [Adineta ricciae]